MRTSAAAGRTALTSTDTLGRAITKSVVVTNGLVAEALAKDETDDTPVVTFTLSSRRPGWAAQRRRVQVVVIGEKREEGCALDG